MAKAGRARRRLGNARASAGPGEASLLLVASEAEGLARRACGGVSGCLVSWLPRPPAPGHERSGLGKGGEAEGFRGEEPGFGRGWRTRSSQIPEELAFNFLSLFPSLVHV